MSYSPIGSYLPVGGALHRLRPGAKLLGLLLFSVGTMAWPGLITTGAALFLGLVAALLAGMRWPELWRLVRGFAVLAVLLFVFHLWQSSWQRGLEVTGTLFALLLAASALTASTAVDDMLDTLTWLLKPLRILGVDVSAVAFSCSVMITSIPRILAIAKETRAAAKARGLDRSPRALLVPFVLRTIAHAQALGAALDARGLPYD